MIPWHLKMRLRAAWRDLHPIAKGGVVGLGYFVAFGFALPPIFWLLGLWWEFWR